jgi:DNA polymerase-3 subunit delta'
MTAPWIARQLQQLLAQRGHAWLLQGPSGLGQYELGLAMAQAWLCDQPTPEGACGQCESCHAVEVRTHADLAVLMPEVTLGELGWPLDEKAQKEIDDKKRKPSKEIRVEAMRDTVEFAQRTSARGRGKAVLVYPAERMNTVTANALLKTLEEPPGDVRFVLASDAAHQLLPTIRSRCLAHTMAWPQEGEAQAWLTGQGVPAQAVPALLRAAGGRPDDALRQHRAGRDPRQWSQLPRAMQRGDVGALAEWPPAEAVGVLQKLCHDLLARQCGAPPRFFETADLPEAGSVASLTEWSRELSRTARTAEHPFNPGLMIEALVSRARSALNSQA